MNRWGKDFLKGKKQTTLAWKCISIALAFVLVVTAFEKGMFQRVFVLAATEAPEEETTEEADPAAGLLDDENGRINFWKWEKVTPQNWKDFYEDEKYHASMFVYYDNIDDKNPGGFLSIYADSNHVFRTSKNERTEFDVAPNVVLDGRYKRVIEQRERKGILYLLDEEGQSLNDQQYFGQDAFFTPGGSMGVLWLQYVKDSEKENPPMSAEGEYFPYFHMALSRAGMKNNPEDESYLDIGSGRGTDYYMKWYQYQDGHDIYEHWDLDTKLDKNQDIDIPEGSNNQSAQIIGLRPWANKQDAKGWSFFNNGKNFVVADGWVLPIDAAMDNIGQTVIESEVKEIIKKGGDSYYYELYVGTPYVFASIKGEGGEDTSGRGSTLTIKKNQLKIVKEGNYSKPDGTSGKSDGVVLPETSKIVIEEGGVLSVEGNFLNNGTIENNGGTIIIKDGGSISPFGNTDEGTIKNVGGTVIVMPKGRLFCLVDDLEKTRPAPPLSMYSSDNQASGLTVISRALVDKAGKIENRNGGTLLVVHKRTDSSVLFHSAKVTGSGQDTSVKGIGMVSLLMDWPCGDYSIHGATENVKPTVVNEKKATFVYKVPDVDYHYLDDNQEEQVYTVKGHDFSKGVNGSGGFTIFTPAY